MYPPENSVYVHVDKAAKKMKRLFSISVFAASFALSGINGQANEPSVFQVSETPSAQTASPEEASPGDNSQVQQTSLTSALSESPACGAAGSGCGAGSREASQGCDGGLSDSTGGCPIFSDDPLLGFLKNQPIGDCWTVSVGGRVRDSRFSAGAARSQF